MRFEAFAHSVRDIRFATIKEAVLSGLRTKNGSRSGRGVLSRELHCRLPWSAEWADLRQQLGQSDEHEQSTRACHPASAQSLLMLRKVERKTTPESGSRVSAGRTASAVAWLACSKARPGQEPVSPGCAAYGDSANPASLECEHDGQLLHQNGRR
jgi:hypothetical protein